MVRTLCCHCRGHGWGTKISRATLLKKRKRIFKLPLSSHPQKTLSCLLVLLAELLHNLPPHPSFPPSKPGCFLLDSGWESEHQTPRWSPGLGSRTEGKRLLLRWPCSSGLRAGHGSMGTARPSVLVHHPFTAILQSCT